MEVNHPWASVLVVPHKTTTPSVHLAATGQNLRSLKPAWRRKVVGGVILMAVQASSRGRVLAVVQVCGCAARKVPGLSHLSVQMFRGTHVRHTRSNMVEFLEATSYFGVALDNRQHCLTVKTGRNASPASSKWPLPATISPTLSRIAHIQVRLAG